MSDPLLIALLAIGGMAVLILLHVPIGPAMGLAGFTAFALMTGIGPAVSLFGTETASALSNLELAVIPLFLLMGGFASAAGLSEDLYRLAYALVGHRRGGLAVATILACAGFGAVCGSSVATAATMSEIALPEMRKRGYRPALAAGSVAAGGTLGILIPPSIIMVIYAFLTEQSVITMYVAAIIPGIIAVAFHLIAIGIVVRLNPDAAPAGPRVDWRGRLVVIRQSAAVISLALVVSGGLYVGAFTATEAAAVGAALSFVFSIVRKRLTKRVFIRCLIQSASTTGLIYMIIVGANVFSYFFTISGLPEAFVAWVGHLNIPPLMIIFILLAIYIVLGAIFDENAALLLTLPLVYPLITGFGFDPIWWGIIMVMVIEIGMIAPPIGLNVFVVHSIATDIPMRAIYAGIMPLLFADFARLALLTVFPAITMLVPQLLGMH
jgi:C4-dicarboxylate transporter DctM subunit